VKASLWGVFAVDDGLAGRGLVIRHRHALRTHFFVRPFRLSQP